MSDARELPDELLADSEAALRLVDSILEGLGEDETGETAGVSHVAQALTELSDRSAELAILPGLLLRAHREIVGALNELKDSRDVFERITNQRVQPTHQKLRAVSSATEVATIDILDGLDRSARLIDKLDEAADTAGDTTGTEDRIRQELRDEIFQLTGVLQFQDITSQQLHSSASVVLDVETRLSSVAEFIERALGIRAESIDSPAENVATHPASADSGTSMLDSADRQAVVDEIFATSDTSDRPSED